MSENNQKTDEGNELLDHFSPFIETFNDPEAKKKIRLENERQHIENQFKREELKDKKQDREEREKNAKKIFKVLVGEVCGVFILFLLQGINIPCGNNEVYDVFHIDNDLWQTFLIGVFAQISATYFIVISYLFPTKHSWVSRLADMLRYKP